MDENERVEVVERLARQWVLDLATDHRRPLAAMVRDALEPDVHRYLGHWVLVQARRSIKRLLVDAMNALDGEPDR